MKTLVLRDYQDRVVDFNLLTPLCGDFLEPGLGKTPAALVTILASLYDRFDTHRWLVVGPPLVVTDSWPRQLRMWSVFKDISWRVFSAEDFGLQRERHIIDETHTKMGGLTYGGRAEKAAAKVEFRAMRETIHLCPKHLFPWLVKAYGKNFPYDGLVLDESLFVANSTSDQHKAAWQVTQRLGAVERLILLNGTPDPNGLEQLHGQIRLLDGGARLGKTKTEFQDKFMVPDKQDRRTGRVWSWKPARGAREEVQGLIGDVCVALRADDHLDLPELVVNPIWVPLPNDARRAYDTIERDLVLQLADATVLAPSQGVLAAKLRQIANGAIYTETGKFSVLSDFKLDRLEDLLAETAQPILLAYQFKSDLERLFKRFGKAVVLLTDPCALDSFRAGTTRLGCIHASAAEGVDGLQDASSTIVWLGATFNARHWIQFNARLRRDGSAASRVVVHMLLADDTVEERYFTEVIPQRVEEQDALLEALKSRAHQG